MEFINVFRLSICIKFMKMGKIPIFSFIVIISKLYESEHYSSISRVLKLIRTKAKKKLQTIPIVHQLRIYGEYWRMNFEFAFPSSVFHLILLVVSRSFDTILWLFLIYYVLSKEKNTKTVPEIDIHKYLKHNDVISHEYLIQCCFKKNV